MKKVTNKTWNGKTLREILRISSPAEFFDWIPPTFVDGIALLALAYFCFAPGLMTILTMRHCFFDRMIKENMSLLDGFVFPLTALCSALAYVLTLWKLRREKRSILGEIRKSPTLVLFALLLAWMCVNFFAVHRGESGVFYTLLLRHESFALNLEYYLGFFALGTALRDESMKRWLLRGLTIISAFMVPFAFYLQKHIVASSMYYDWQPSFASVFTNPNYYGYFLSVSIGLCAGLFAAAERPRWRLLCALSLILNTTALGFNGTRGAWVGASAACLFLVVACRVRDGKFKLWTLAALGLFALTLSVTVYYKNLPRLLQTVQDIRNVMENPTSNAALFGGSYRWLIWNRCLEIIRDNPLWGIGFEGLALRGLDIYVGNTRPHNEFMQYALFYGIPAGILYTLGCVSVYWRAVKCKARLDNLTLAALTAAFGYLIGSFFGVTVYNTAPFLFVMLGLGYVHADAKEIPDHVGAEENADAEEIPARVGAEEIPRTDAEEAPVHAP